MNNYEASVDIDPKDKYEKAKKDLCQALISLRELNAQEQHQLANELFGAAKVDFLVKIVQSYNENKVQFADSCVITEGP